MNPLNVLMVGTFLSYALVAMPDGSFKKLSAAVDPAGLHPAA
jgi:hypothetical protein